MANPNSFFSKLSRCFLSVMRIATALLFMQHGGQKLFSIPPAQQTPSLMSLMGMAGVLELFGVGSLYSLDSSPGPLPSYFLGRWQ